MRLLHQLSLILMDIRPTGRLDGIKVAVLPP